MWVLRFEGQSCRIPNARGLEIIQRLLMAQGKPVEVEVLDAGGDSFPRSKGEADVVLDNKAREEYEKRCRDLEGELAEARRNNDLAKQKSQQEELRSLADELGRHTGLGGRHRRLGDETEKTRHRVGNAIKTALKKVQKDHPALRDHLWESIRRPFGTAPSYSPNSPVTWILAG